MGTDDFNNILKYLLDLCIDSKNANLRKMTLLYVIKQNRESI